MLSSAVYGASAEFVSGIGAEPSQSTLLALGEYCIGVSGARIRKPTGFCNPLWVSVTHHGFLDTHGGLPGNRCGFLGHPRGLPGNPRGFLGTHGGLPGNPRGFPGTFLTCCRTLWESAEYGCSRITLSCDDD